MGNMSYCRFENTVGDLGDCQMALENMLNGDESQLNKTERSEERRVGKECRL